MTLLPNLDHLPPEQLRALAAQLMQRVEMLDHQVDTLGKTVSTMGNTVETMGKKINRDQTVIEKLPHEIAQLKRMKFAKRSEQMNPEQASLFDDLIDTDIAAIDAELQSLQAVIAPAEKKQKPKYTPGVFTVERYVHGKRVCDDCKTLIQAPVPAQVIDKGIPTAGLLAHVMIAKFADLLPLYRR